MTFKKNKLFNIPAIALVLFSIIAASCNKELNKLPETQLTDAGFWKTTTDLQNACNYLYSFLPSIDNFPDNMSDVAFSTSPNSVSDGSFLVPATSSDWTNNYKLIRASNTILEKAPQVSGDSSIIKRYMGEASFFRAYAYFQLLERYGNVPLILRTFDVNDTLATAHRTDRETIVDSIYADLNYASAHCPLPSALLASEFGRITSIAALAFKSRVALFEGTWDKFHQQGDYVSHLKVAIAASDSVINSGQCSLFVYTPDPDSSYHYLFQYQGEGPSDKEIILARIYGQNMTNLISGNNISSDEDNALTTPTRALMDSYLYTDGLPLGKSSLEVPQTTTLSEFQNRDPRAGMTVFNKNMWYITSKYQPNFIFTVTGYKFNKWFNAVDRPVYGFIDFAIIRYAEVLLNYAEATYELNEGISDNDLNKSINLIRARVNMPPLTNEFVQSNSLEMRTEIRRERTVELAEEGFRYWDLLRWKTAEIELPKAILGAKYFPAEQGKLDNPNLTADSIIIAEPSTKRMFDPSKDYLWPIPTNELGLDPNLTQNPNW